MRSIIHRRAAGIAALAAGAALGLSAGASAQTPSAVAAPEGPPPATSAVPIPPGQVDAAVGRLDGIVGGVMARSGVPGMAVAVVHDDRVVYAKGFGVRRVGTDERVDANTVFQLASLSKPVGATVVARAVGGGRVHWSDPITRFLPRFRLSSRASTREVTIADMYSHRSGLPDHAGDLLEDLGYGRAQVLRRLRFLPLTPIRTEYAYTNFGLTAGALAVARAEHTSWARLSERELYRPLGMTSTSSTFAGYRAARDRAEPHVRVGGRWVPTPHVRDADAQSPAGGVSSSAADMAKWMRLQLGDGMFEGRRIVPARQMAEIHTPHSLSSPPATPDSRSGFYGLGFNVSDDWTGRVRLSHSGAFALGAGTNFVLLPSEHLGIVVLTNGIPIGAAEAVSATFMDLAETGRVERDWYPAYHGRLAPMLENHGVLAGRRPPAHPRRARPARAYAGTYANRYYGPARITARRGRLTMHLGPRGRGYRLRHWSGNTFSYVPPGENAPGITAVRFRMRHGRAASVWLENLDAEGLGTFTRR